MTTDELDFDAKYTVDGWSGIAWYISPRMVSPHTVDDDFCFVEDEYVQDEQFVIAVMVGDDREHVIDVDDLTVLDEDAYCHECGQVGCIADGRER